MGNNFRSDRNDRGRGRSFGGGGLGRRNFDRGGGGGRDRDRQMFKAICANCGKDCEVPFRPSNDKPVYCSDCFEKMGGGGRREGQNERPRFDDRRPQSGGNQDQYKGQFENLNIKLDKILRLLEPKTKVPEPIKAPEKEVKVDKESGGVMKAEKQVEVVKEPEVKDAPKVKKVSKKSDPKKKASEAKK